MANKINKVTAAVIQAMKKKSALGLPDRPSEAGLTPTQIKTAFADFVTGPTQSALAEIDRVATEVTAVLSKLFEGVYDELPTDLARFENDDKIILTNGSIYKYNANQGAFVKTNDELESIVNEIQQEVRDLDNYYTKTEIDAMIGDIETLLEGI